MTARKIHDEIVLSCSYGNAWRPHGNSKLQSNFGGNNAKSMKVALKASLTNLQTTYVDIFYVAWWDHTTSIPELMHGLNDLVAAGKVLYLGIVDTPAWIVAKANEYARQKGLRQFAVYGGLSTCESRGIECDIVPMCADEGMAICSLPRSTYFVPTEKQRTMPAHQHGSDLEVALKKVGKPKVASNAAQVDVAYVRAKAPYVFVVITPTTVADVESMLAALDVVLSEQDIQVIESSYKFAFGYPYTALSGTMFTTGQSKGAAHPAHNPRLNKLGRFDWVGKLRAIGWKSQ